MVLYVAQIDICHRLRNAPKVRKSFWPVEKMFHVNHFWDCAEPPSGGRCPEGAEGGTPHDKTTQTVSSCIIRQACFKQAVRFRGHSLHPKAPVTAAGSPRNMPLACYAPPGGGACRAALKVGCYQLHQTSTRKMFHVKQFGRQMCGENEGYCKAKCSPLPPAPLQRGAFACRKNVSRETIWQVQIEKMFHVKQFAATEKMFHVKQFAAAEKMFHVKQFAATEKMFHVKQFAAAEKMFHVKQFVAIEIIFHVKHGTCSERETADRNGE